MQKCCYLRSVKETSVAIRRGCCLLQQHRQDQSVIVDVRQVGWWGQLLPQSWCVGREVVVFFQAR